MSLGSYYFFEDNITIYKITIEYYHKYRSVYSVYYDVENSTIEIAHSIDSI